MLLDLAMLYRCCPLTKLLQTKSIRKKIIKQIDKIEK